MTMKKMGMRTIKSGIAVIVSILISHLLNLPNSFFVAYTSMLVMETAVITSYKIARIRIAGTFFGAMLGTVFTYFLPGNALITGIGVVIIIYVFDLLAWNKALTLSGIVFLSTMLTLGDKSPLEYGFSRLFETFLGIVIALVINFFVYPPKPQKKIEDMYNDLHSTVLNISKRVLEKGEEVPLEDIIEQTKAIKAELEVYLSEISLSTKRKLNVDNLYFLIEECREIYVHLRVIENLTSFESSEIYNYHYRKAIDGILKLEERSKKLTV